MHITIYTDASHSPEHKIAACGYFIIKSGTPAKHEVILAKCETSSEAEVLAIVLAIKWVKAQSLKGMTLLTIKTDHQGILLGTKNNKKGFRELGNLLNEFRNLGVRVQLKFVKSHSGNTINTLVDSSVRKQLRAYLKDKTS